MQFECKYTFHPKPHEPNEFIDAHTIEVVCFQENDEPVVVARLAIDHLDIVRVESEGQIVFHVCDADSGGWAHVYAATMELTTNFAEIRKDFGFNDAINGLLFLHRSVFHPLLRDWQQMILDRILVMFREDTGTVMWKTETDMTDKELASLGFRVVAGSDLLFRPNMLRTEYSAVDDDRDPFYLVFPSDAGDFVDEQWELRERE